MTGAPAIAVKGVTKHFGGVVALADVSMEVRAGEVCGLIGPNGAGKTTLFDIISGMVAPTSGTIEIAGVAVRSALPERRARAGVRRTFQRVQLAGDLTVEDNVLLATEWRGGGGGLVADLVAWPGRRRREAERRERVAATLLACGLAALAGQRAGSLPIGLARRVELARAVVDRPKVLLLDEPTSGLSDGETRQVAALVAQQRGDGVAVIVVEHDVGFVMTHCDRVVVLDRGRVIAAGTPAAVQADGAVRAAYLG